jgi:CheY-like chemotaxis protein/HPt (histidine-containing phosphotransfer) domain-containing protein
MPSRWHTRRMLDFGAKQNLPTVMLIDDDLVSREVMATVLTMSGYTVHTASGGDASLDLLAAGECTPDVILMDAQMPGLSGSRLIAELRTRTRATVYAISGSNAPDDVIAASDGFLLKPFGADALNRLLEEHAAQANPSSAPSIVADEPVVNPETLAQLRAIMPESAVREIYLAVVADLSKKVGALQIAFAQRDNAEIRRIGHAIKGGCAMAGAQQAARLGAILETSARSATPGKSPSSPAQNGNQLDNSSALLKDLRAASLNLQRMLEIEFPA